MPKVFFKHHEFMIDVFVKTRRYDFEVLVGVLAGLSSFFVIPNSTPYAENKLELQHMMLRSFTQTLTRGYHLFAGSHQDLIEMLIDRMSVIFSKQFDRRQVEFVVDLITLTEDIQRKISPWSNGPRCVIIPADGFFLVDLVSTPALLHSIFVFLPDKFGESGTVFEKLFKDALERRGYDVQSGRLVANDGLERELDAGVIIGDEMYIFECVSIERPLDYEIGRPRTMAVRQDRLSQKVDQAKSLHAFVSQNPIGRNYDFSAAKNFTWVVVSPFVEWIWDLRPELWLDSNTPRILSPDEAFSLLHSEDGKALHRETN